MVDTSVEKLTGAENILWDLSVYFDNLDDPRINQTFERVNQKVDAFALDYRGKVADLTAEELGEAYERMEAIYDEFGHAATYASLNFSVYSGDAKWGAFMQKIQEQYASIGQRMVFFELEWNTIDDDKAKALLADPVLRTYRYHLETERRYKPYQLSEAEEKLLIEKSVTGRSAWQRFFTQITSAMQPEYDGEKMPLPQVLSIHRTSPDRAARKKAAEAVTKALADRKMELTYIFNVAAADKASDDRLRGYPSWITSRNLANKAADATVEALIKAVTENYDLVARHYNIKRALLGYDELFDWDRYAPLNLKESDAFFSWDAARQMTVDAYSRFAPQIGEIAAKFFDNNWIHAPIMNGKRGGAYASYGTKSTHPWVFVNYTGAANDVMTLAHELGHGLHMYLAGQKQTLFSMYTPLTTAEMASVFGEMIVFQDLMQKEPDKEVQLSMLTNKIDDTFATVFRQVSMNRFEDGLHTSRRSEGELSMERINEIWLKTQRDMFQGSVTMTDDYGSWWMYVSHFIDVPGYVYAYAFGELLVLALYNLYQQEGASFVPKYLELLSSGDSDYPEKLLAKIGVDLNDPDFWNQGIEEVRKLIEQEEALAKELYPDKF
jgi:oligoendopeptidase F